MSEAHVVIRHDEFQDRENISWLASPKALIEIDRELVRRGGLRVFMELAWHVVEPATVFVPNWHIDEMCAELQQVIDGANTRLAMAIPPRHCKSNTLAVFMPAYAWIMNPARRMMFVSYDFSLSLRDSKRTRDLVSSEWFQERWGHIFKLKTDNAIILETNNTGYREAASVGGRVMGKGADIIVCDDPHDTKDVESDAKRTEVLLFWRERLQSRLNDPKTGAFIVCHQRVGENDVIGDIQKRQKGEYRYMSFPARFDPNHPNIWQRDPRKEPGELLWPSHMPAEVIDRFETNLGAYAFSSQFQQLPGPREGGLFKNHWFTKIRKEELPGDVEWCRGYDFAGTIKQLVKSDPDWTATVLIGHSMTTKLYYIGHVQRWRVEAGEVERIILSTAQNDVKTLGPRIRIRYPQDPGSAGKGYAQRIGQVLAGFSFMCEPVTGDKAQNAAPLAAQAMIGNVRMVIGDWNDDFMAEMTGFPAGAHDDMVDAASQAFKGFMKSSTGLLDYYSAQLEKQKAASVPVQEGIRVSETKDLGVGFAAKSKP